MHFYFNDYPGNELFWEMLRIYYQDMDLPLRIVLCLYPIFIVYFALRGTIKERLFIFTSVLVYILVCLNPYMCRIICDKLGFYDRFFRFFWLLPVMFTYLLGFIKVYEYASVRTRRKIYIGSLLLLIASFGIVLAKTSFHMVFVGKRENKGMMPVSNVYKVEDDVVSISNLINSDSSKFEKKCLYGRNLYMEMRAYDPSLLLPQMPWNYLSINPVKDIQNKEYRTIVSMFFNGQEFENCSSMMTSELLGEAVEALDYDYIIVDNENAYYSVWNNTFENLGKLEEYTIFKVK